MYSDFTKKEKQPPTDYELTRLRRSQTTARINNILLEGFDLITDFAFILVLFDQSIGISLPSTWYTIAFECGLGAPAPGEQEIKDQVYQLAIAAAFFFTINAVFRAASGVFQIASNFYRIKGTINWFVVLFGLGVTVVDPWNGALLIESSMEKEYEDKELDDYLHTVQELKSDWILVWLENIPQFIIQVWYALVIAESQHLGLPAAWFVAVFTTVLHLLSQGQEILYLHQQLPSLRELAKASPNRPTTIQVIDETA